MKRAATHIRGTTEKEDKSFEGMMDAWTQCLNWAKTGELPVKGEGK